VCGFVGSVRWDKPDSTERIEALLNRLVHRGPDAGAVQAFGAAVLGHRRLSIIDTTAAANQPMVNADGRKVIVFNGEIYNFKELRAQLQQTGVTFRTQSDTEVVLAAWEYWGDRFVEQLRGMFAFALWDMDRQRLLLGRDRAGEKPLFYTFLKDGIVFGSELKSIRVHPEVDITLNPKAISQYLTLHYILSDCSILQKVYKLPAAHMLIFEAGKRPKIYPYWDLKGFFRNKHPWTEKEAIHQFHTLFADSIRGQSISDVPLGAFLSGGIDSSAVSAILSRQLSSPQLLKTFSIGFEERSFSELPAAERIARELGVNHYAQVIKADVVDALPKIIYHADEPFADTSIIPTYYLAQMTRQQVTVALTGDGSDELFAGYVTNTADRIHSVLQYVPKSLLHMACWFMHRILPVTFDKVSFDYKLRQFLRGAHLPFAKAHFSWRHIFSDHEKMQLLRGERRDTILASVPFASVAHYFEEVNDCHILDQAAYVDFKTWLVDDILVKVDRATMAHSLEARAPFLDHRIIEFAASLPPHFKMRYWTKKYILKRAMAGILPDQTLSQQKKGFNAPVSYWLSGVAEDFAKGITLSSLMHEWFSLAFIEKLWQDHKQKVADHGLKLFALTCFGIWLDQINQERKVI
jgi:asparagine synthase (glutamine-hydrolysing)